MGSRLDTGAWPPPPAACRTTCIRGSGSERGSEAETSPYPPSQIQDSSVRSKVIRRSERMCGAGGHGFDSRRVKPLLLLCKPRLAENDAIRTNGLFEPAPTGVA